MTREIIHVGLYGGKGIFGGRETPLEASVISCDKHDSCSYFKDNQCMAIRGFSSGCKFGSERTVKGYTSRAQKYHQFRNKWREHEQYGKLKRPSDKLGLVDGVVVFPYSYVRIKVSEDGKPFLNSPSFNSETAHIDYDKFTSDFIYQICTFRPQAMMGGEITDYQKKTVPLFLAHLKEVLPEKYEEFINQYESYSDAIDYVGREALLNTIKPSVVHYEASSYPKFNEEWIWDGKLLTYDNGYVSSFNIAKDCEIKEIVIKPSDDTAIKISSNEQVLDTTVFID